MEKLRRLFRTAQVRMPLPLYLEGFLYMRIYGAPRIGEVQRALRGAPRVLPNPRGTRMDPFAVAENLSDAKVARSFQGCARTAGVGRGGGRL